MNKKWLIESEKILTHGIGAPIATIGRQAIMMNSKTNQPVANYATNVKAKMMLERARNRH